MALEMLPNEARRARSEQSMGTAAAKPSRRSRESNLAFDQKAVARMAASCYQAGWRRLFLTIFFGAPRAPLTK